MMESQDESHLRLLSISHYIFAGLGFLFSSMFLGHFFIGLAVLMGAPIFQESGGDVLPPEAFGVLGMVGGGGLVLAGWTVAACLMLAGRSIAQRKRYVFCLFVAIAICAMCPLGIVLGVFTIVVLMRPSVRQLFGVNRAAPIGA